MHLQTLAKKLADLMVAQSHTPDMPVAIVRPSFVSGVAGDPYPGYVGNLAGHVGAAVVWFQGFVSVDTTSVQPYSLFDTVPADVAASLIIGAAAALAARIDLSTIPGPNVRVEPGQILAKPQIYHGSTSALAPLCTLEGAVWINNFDKRYKPLPFKLGRNLDPDVEVCLPQPRALSVAWLGFKVSLVSGLLKLFGQKKIARGLDLSWKFFYEQMSNYKHNYQVTFNCDRAVALEQLLSPEERALFPVVWRQPWERFVYTCLAGLSQIYLGKTVRKTSEHDFVPIPNTYIPNNKQQSAQPAVAQAKVQSAGVNGEISKAVRRRKAQDGAEVSLLDKSAADRKSA